LPAGVDRHWPAHHPVRQSADGVVRRPETEERRRQEVCRNHVAEEEQPGDGRIKLSLSVVDALTSTATAVTPEKYFKASLLFSK